MKHQITIAAKTLLAATVLLFAGVANAQSTGTQTVVFAEPGSTTGLTTYARSQGREFSIDIVYDDTVTDRSVVAFNVHWDDSEVTFGGIENLKAIADSDSAACQVGGSQPTAVGTAGNNTKVGGPSLTIGGDAGVAEGDDDDTLTETDQKATAVWAQICGDVFTEDDAVRVATAKFTWKETSTATSTKIGLSQAHGGDFGASTFSGQSVEILPQTFGLDVDDSGGNANSADGIMVARYLILNARGGNITTGFSSTPPAQVQSNLDAGAAGPLDVDASGGRPNSADGIMVARFLILNARGSRITDGFSATDPATVQGNLEALR
ncbi:MAG: hypothetical protein MPK11_04240 [Gammaproteobacteria bacterium]|nr:hypothetical protein [Gammaproteobacteria bacterium]